MDNKWHYLIIDLVEAIGKDILNGIIELCRQSSESGRYNSRFNIASVEGNDIRLGTFYTLDVRRF